MLRLLAIVCAVVTCGLLAWAGYTSFHPPASPATTGETGEPGLIVEDPVREVGELPVGVHHITFRVTNRSDRPGEIVGTSGQCGKGCCLRFPVSDRPTIAPGATIELVGELDIRWPVPLEVEGEVYLNDGGRLRVVPLRVTGTGVKPAGNANANPPQ